MARQCHGGFFALEANADQPFVGQFVERMKFLAIDQTRPGSQGGQMRGRGSQRDEQIVAAHADADHRFELLEPIDHLLELARLLFDVGGVGENLVPARSSCRRA